MSESYDFDIRQLAFGRPSKNSAYLTIIVPNGTTYRFHFGSKGQVKLIRSEATQVEDSWPD